MNNNKPNKNFLFVTVNHPDNVKQKKTQRSIRSRAIRDALRGQRKQPKSVTFSLEKVSIIEDNGRRDRCCRGTKPDTINASIQKSLYSWPFPGEMRPRVRELIYFSEYSDKIP